MSIVDAGVAPAPKHVGISRVTGTVVGLIGILAAVATAVAIDHVARGHLAIGVALLTAALLARWLVQLGGDSVAARASRTLRRQWHDRSRLRLALSSPAQLHSLDTAVDHVADEPAVEATRASASASLLALVVLFVEGGWLPTLIVLALMALSVPAYVQVGRHSVAYMDEYHRRRGALVARQLALLRAMVDLRALGAVEFGADEMKAASDAESRAVVEGVRLTIRSTLVTEFLGGVSVGLVAMVVGIRLWHHTIGLRPALISVFVVAEMFNWLRRYGAEFHRRDDAAQARQLLSDVEPAVTISPSSNLLELADVSTEAPAGSVSLSLTSGSRVRITGPSGIGKSSLLEAALGLREPVSGTVRRGAHRVGFVRSDSRFLRSSLRENIDPRGHASDIEIAATIDAVGLSSDRFGDLDALLDDDSRSLSSGERVQLAFARAIVADVDLLVIDDVAGLLDTRVRSRLAALIEAREQWGVLEASHDVAVIDAADVIELRSRT